MVLAMWVIYDRPLDYPRGYLARQWLVTPNGLAASNGEVITGASLDEVRDKLAPFGLHRIQRDPRDEPQIVETWL